jgi:serine/threonine-protein kinase
MILTSGTRLGPYEILSPLGAGGMGEVYKARDTRLKREVALKVLPAAFSQDPDRLARFQREAELLAALNHPYIAHIHGLEETDGIRALVMELVEGPTLADRIAQGPIPLDEALPIAQQLAEALGAAHEQGIIHRDLNPANIKVREDGTVKVLDFGLAKLTAPEASGAGAMAVLSQSPTLTTPAATLAGVILGTAAYMSPEQAKGRAADRRSDVWAFGCVLYEMLTGKRAFEGEDVSDTLAAVLRGEPNWAALPADTPVSIHVVLKRCLEKDRAKRIAEISTVHFLLTEPASVGLVPPLTPLTGAVPPRSAWHRAFMPTVALATLMLLVGAGGVTIGRMRTRGLPPRIERLTVMSTDSEPFDTQNSGVNVAISPDGSQIVYTATRGSASQLLVRRRLDQLQPIPIAGGEGGRDPFFSPDGQQLGLITADGLKTVAIGGGPSATVCRIPQNTFRGGSWGANNWIFFAQGGDSGLFRVSAAGGVPEKIASPDASQGELDYSRPEELPGGQALLYTVALRGRAATRIVARALTGGPATIVVEGGFNAHYLSSGHLVYGQGDRLMAVPFDVATLQVKGSAMPVLEGVLTKVNASAADVAVALDGTMVYVSGAVGRLLRHPVWIDRSGKHVDALVEQALDYPRYPRVSPDGRRVALTIGPASQGNIWIYDVRSATQPIKVTFQAHNTFPIWSPEGSRLAFLSTRAGSGNLFSIPADGSALEPDRLTTGQFPQLPTAWYGEWLLYSENSPQSRWDVWRLHMTDQKPTPWLKTDFAERAARFSPDGHWVTYVSNQTGDDEVWVRPFPGPGSPVRVSPNGGHDPVWSHDGKELFYDNGPQLLSARVLADQTDFRVEAPRGLFEGGFVQYAENAPSVFDVAPDGRFLMIAPNDATPASAIIVVTNWFEELKARVPVTK